MYEKHIQDVVDYCKEQINDMKEELYGGEERSSDLMVCGYADGRYDTYIEILEFLGVDHGFTKTFM